MISDNLFHIAVFVFIIMMIGLVLTFIEFRYGEPKRQQELADRKAEAAIKDDTAR